MVPLLITAWIVSSTACTVVRAVQLVAHLAGVA